ncbi:MAG: cation:proton antiporter [Nanoarchaeota archaeon]
MEFPIELVLIILFAIAGGVLAVRFRQPSVLGLILVGALVGPNALGLIKDTNLINIAAEVGAVLLLFAIGVEFSMKNFINLGTRGIAIAVVKLGSIILISLYLALILGLSFITSLYIGVILAVTSTVIMIKVLEQKGIANRKEVPLLITVLIIEDIFSIFVLAFFSSLNTRADLELVSIITRLILSLAALLFVYLVLRKILRPAINWLIHYSAEDTITFVSLGLLAGMSYLALVLKLSPAVGAFLAGSIVASLPNSDSFKSSIHPFILTFTALFFFSIGTLVNFSAIHASIILILIFFFANILLKFVFMGFSSFLFTSFTGRSAVFSGLAMLSVGEFSLLIAKEAQPLNLGIDLISITAAVIVLSTFAMAFSLPHEETIYRLTTRIIPARVKREVGILSTYLNNISWQMVADVASASQRRKERKAITANLIVILTISCVAFLIWRFSGLQTSLLSYFVIVLLLSLLPLFNLSRHANKLIRDVSALMKKVNRGEGRHIFRNLLFLAITFSCFLIYPFIHSSLSLPAIFHSISLALILIMVWLTLAILKSIHFIFLGKEKNYAHFSQKYVHLIESRLKKR